MTNAAGKRVLVTGATGFLGRYVIRALKDSGWQIRLACRSGPMPSRHESVVVGPIDGLTDWRAALKDVDAIVHLAARAHQSRSAAVSEREVYFDVNTAGTLQLARASAGQCSAFLFVSTILVNGARTNGRAPFTETDRSRPAGVYAESKARAEDGLATIAANAELPTTIVRPPLIYGRHAKGNFALLARAVRAGVPLPLGAIRNRRAFVAAENVAAFLSRALATPETYQGVFIVADDEQISTAELVRRMAAAMNRRPRLLDVPPAILDFALRAARRSAIRDGLLASLEVDTSKASRCGWHPVVTLDDGLRLALSPSQSVTD